MLLPRFPPFPKGSHSPPPLICLLPLCGKPPANPRALLHRAFCLNFTSHHLSPSFPLLFSSAFCQLPGPSTPLLSDIATGQQLRSLLWNCCRGVFLRMHRSVAGLLASKFPSPSCCAAVQKLPKGWMKHNGGSRETKLSAPAFLTTQTRQMLPGKPKHKTKTPNWVSTYLHSLICIDLAALHQLNVERLL